MYRKSILATCVAGLFIAPLVSTTAFAAVSADEAAKLKTTLTPLGGRARRQCRWQHPGLDRWQHQSPGRLQKWRPPSRPVPG